MSTIHASRPVILANVRGFIDWATSPDTPLPDPIGFADARWLVSQAPKAPALSQLLERQFLAQSAGEVWGARKDDRSCREMVLVPWPAQVVGRLLLHEGAQQLVERQRPRCYAGRVALCEPRGTRVEVLTTRPFRPAFGEWNSERLRLASTDPPVALKTDIQRFYPSVRPSVVAEIPKPLIAMESSFGIRMLLEKIQNDSGVSGLPITAEISPWLANQVLYRLDELIEGSPGLVSTRWSDDEFLVDGVPSLVEYGQSIRTQELRRLGLTSSEEKTIRSWELEMTGRELLMSSYVSQGDITWHLIEESMENLWISMVDELREVRPDKSRLNRLFGVLRGKPSEDHWTPCAIEKLLEDPELWERSCSRASAFMATHASAEHVGLVVQTAIDLNKDGLVTAEQVMSLVRAVAQGKHIVPSHEKGHLAGQLLRLARSGSCVPVRMWARYAAFTLDPARIRAETIDSGEFEHIHSFEQRIGISFSDPQRHHWWLQEQIDRGSWPSTAKWKLKTG